MKLSRLRDRLFLQEDLNFLLTNRIPRILLTQWMGRYSAIQSPLLTRLSIAVWRVFTDLDLSEARQQDFNSLRECFIRELKPGARRVDHDPDTLSSPCDAIVGACGDVRGMEVFQAKGYPYSIRELFGSSQDISPFVDGTYVTLRLTSSMYHRFHAPYDGQLDHVTYLSGDVWNVNPIALKRIERLFCKNERAVLRTRIGAANHPLAIVPVAAVLVASIRLHAINVLMHLRWKGPHEIPCAHAFGKGEELGWFEHGSTIIVFAPKGFRLAHGIQSGQRIQMGQALMVLPDNAKNQQPT